MTGIQLLGWLRQGLPPRPKQDKARGGGRRHKAAAPPAGSGASEAGAEQPPNGDGSSSSSSNSGSKFDGAGGAQQHVGGKLVTPLPGAIGITAILSSARQWGFLWKALAVHSANLAASLAARPLQPLHERLQRQLAATSAIQDACRQLQVEGLSELQDLMNCIILSEHVYKIVDHSADVSLSLMNAMKAEFPPHLVTLKSVLWAQPHVQHRFLLGESDDALYVSFMGTKLPRDMATNANLFQEEVVLDAAMLSSGAADALEGGAGGATSAPGPTGQGPHGSRMPAAHRGFLARARSVPIHSLYREAQAKGKRLVLCGHSLGGAVASLCAIQLLQHLPPNLHHTVSCYGFATPALGNEALAAKVAQAGWSRRILNYLSPDDPIPKLLSFRKPPPSAADRAAAAAPAEQAAVATGGTAAAAQAVSLQAQQQEIGSSRGAAAEEHPDLQRTASTGHADTRLRRIASHVTQPALVGAAGGVAAAEAPAGNDSASSGIPRSSSAPALLARVGSAPDSPPKAGTAPNQQHQQQRGGRFARVGVAAATSAAVAAAVLGQDVDVAAATSAAVAAAMLRQEGAAAHVQSASGAGPASPERSAAGEKRGRQRQQHWLGQRFAAAAAPPLRAAAQRASSAALAAAAPPVRAVVERAGSAARLVTLPLSAAASVPMRAAPQYLPVGRQLYITPSAVSATKPAGGSFKFELPPAASGAASSTAANSAAAPAQQLQQQHRPVWPFWGLAAAGAGSAVAAASRAAAASGAAGEAGGGSLASGSLGSSFDVEDNVDVAAAAALNDPAAVAAATGSDEGAAVSGSGTAGAGSGEGGKKRKRGGLFEAHRMATYRQRLLGICQASLEGRLLVRSLPMLPNLPRPGDVVTSELLAPAMFPLRATATLAAPASEAPAAAAGEGQAAAAASQAAGAAGAAVGSDTQQRQPVQGQQQPQQRPQRRGFWQRLLARAVLQQRSEPPVELLIRVEGRGLANVTQAWIEGIPPAPADSAKDGSKQGGGSSISEAGGSATASSSSSSSSKPSAAATTVAEVTIVQQPRTLLLPPERPPLPMLAQLSAFASWLAVSLGWVALLRQLQPAGQQDFLLARVRLPAEVVRDAQRAAQNSLLTSVTDGPLLHSLQLGPRLSLRLQSDFAVHSLPLDIRVAADVRPQAQPPWSWFMQRQQAQRPARRQPSQQRPQAQRRWWDWPAAGTPAGSH